MAVNKMTGRNEYRCHFCNKLCQKCGKAEGYTKYAQWHYCNNCPAEVWFAVGPTSKIKGMTLSVKDKEDKEYRMEINYKTKRTKIYQMVSTQEAVWGLHDVEYVKKYVRKDILTLDKCVNDVTPENVMEKIKMYILFS